MVNSELDLSMDVVINYYKNCEYISPISTYSKSEFFVSLLVISFELNDIVQIDQGYIFKLKL